MADVGVVLFPGSNCERDTLYVFSEVLGLSTEYHWYKEAISKPYKLVVLPGGFSYGDYLRSGAIAAVSAAVESLGEYIEKGGYVLGICNGFQILTEAGYLPGALMRNESLHFQSEDVFCRVESVDNPFLSSTKQGEVLRLPIAHADGRYFIEAEDLSRLERKGQVALRYSSKKGEIDTPYNANGSVSAIAGVLNEKKNVFGLMPHPERSAEEALRNLDGMKILESIRSHL